MINWMPIRKIAAVALTALFSATGFVAWLAGTGNLDWRGWVAIVATAVAPTALGYFIPSAEPAGAEPLLPNEPSLLV